MSDESIKPHAPSNNSLAPRLNYINTKIRVKLEKRCLKQDKVTFTHKKVANNYIAYEINLWPFNVAKDFVLGNSLFGAVKLIKNADLDNYNYSSYYIGFEVRGSFPLSDGSGIGKTVIIFGIDMSSLEGPADGLDDTTLNAEKEYSINVTEQQKKFCLSLHYNGVNSYLFVNDVETYKFKATDSEINAVPLFLGNVSKCFSVDNMKKTGLYGYVHDFSVDYDSIECSSIMFE